MSGRKGDDVSSSSGSGSGSGVNCGGEEEEKEELEDEFEDEFTYFKGPYLFGTPDLTSVKDMPSLLGQEAQDQGGAFLRISAR